MTDEKQEPHVVDGDEYLGVYDAMVRDDETERDATRRVLTMIADESYRRTSTLRAERDRLREALERIREWRGFDVADYDNPDALLFRIEQICDAALSTKPHTQGENGDG